VPLKKGYSKKSKDHNFKELKKSRPDMPAEQRVAIVLDTARRAAGKAGKPSKGPASPKRARKRKG
jgi:hypothetical protein